MRMKRRDKPRQQIRRDGINDAHTQRPNQWIFALPGNVLELGRFLQHSLCLLGDSLADRGRANVSRRALEKNGAQSRLHLFQRHRKCRLADVAFLRRPPKMAFLGQSHDIAQFGQRHARKKTIEDEAAILPKST